MLGAAQEESDQPVVVVVDDLHWVDQESAGALLFAGRRLRADRVLIVASARPGELARLGDGWSRFIAGDDRVTRIGLTGFGREELVALGVALGVGELRPGVVRSLLAHTAGNPLYCRALLEELTPEDLRRAGDRGIRAPRGLGAVILGRLSGLSGEARDLVIAASVLGLRAPLAAVCALAELGDPAAAVDEAAWAGLLEERDGVLGRELAFVQLLVHHAVYDDVSRARRDELHERAARLLGGEGSLEHRVAAASGVDDELAGELERAARAASAERRTGQAARWLAHASALSANAADRDRRLLDAFEQLLVPGDVTGASALEPDARRLGGGARSSGLLGQLALLQGDGAGAEQRLREAWRAHDAATEPLVGAAAAAYMSLHCINTGRAAEALVWADRAMGAAGGASRDLEGGPVRLGRPVG